MRRLCDEHRPNSGESGYFERRRGMSLVIVMVALSTSLVLTYAFVRTQATVLQISQNSTRRDLALQAAQTGAAVALERMASSEWQGVDERLSRIIDADRTGTSRYIVEYQQPESGDSIALPDDGVLEIVIRSTGVWQSADASRETVERHVEAIVRLRPRLPGTTDPANDVSPNPGDYDAIQKYALFANGNDSLEINPCGRIEGDVWLYKDLEIYEDPNWDNKVRDELLASIGRRYVVQGTIQHPHPLAGHLTFRKKPSKVKHDLKAMQTPWSETNSEPQLSAIDFQAWKEYLVFDRGFSYTATSLNGTEGNVVLEPSATNPLGVFHRDGSVRLDDEVTIQGTLVATGTVTIAGSVKFRDSKPPSDGAETITADASSWPRLPAIVAREVIIGRGANAVIDGAVILQESLLVRSGAVAEIHGPVSAKEVQIEPSPKWRDVPDGVWQSWNAWKELNPEAEFVDWLNALGWSLEPTFYLRHRQTDVKYRWSPPLFQAYEGTAVDRESAGYRWEVLSWRELP